MTQDYTVTIESERGETEETVVSGKRNALIQAKEDAEANPDCNVYVSFLRTSDGQRVWLNPDGNHAITGEAHNA